eukprot:4531326-Karenia_brevis.AAC.1
MAKVHEGLQEEDEMFASLFGGSREDDGMDIDVGSFVALSQVSQGVSAEIASNPAETQKAGARLAGKLAATTFACSMRLQIKAGLLACNYLQMVDIARPSDATGLAQLFKK